MAAFPHTAPRLTEKQRLQEIELLPKAEKDRIKNELNGTDRDYFLEDNVDVQSCTLGMQQVIDQMSIQEKMDYEEACIHVPELVKEESGSIKFLRKHHYDCKKAARNLVSYWAHRVQLFGREKAFLPMTINGALSDDFETLETGFFQFLGTDDHGRSILYHEKPKTDPTIHHRDSLRRVLFHMLHATHSPNGCVLIVNLRTMSMKHIDRLYAKKGFEGIMEAPMAVKALFIPSPTTSWLLHQTVFLPVLLAVVPKGVRNRLCSYDCAKELEEYGIPDDKVPLAAMGSFTEGDAFEVWLEDQMQKERNRT